MSIIEALFQTPLIAQGTIDTLIMVGISTLFAYVFGTILGVILVVIGPRGLCRQPVLSALLSWIINIGRSLPFIILLLFLLPATRALTGTTLGVTGALFPLIVSATPFVARMVEQSLLEVDDGLIEAAQAMGAHPLEIILKVYLVEALPSLLRGLPIVAIALLGYTAMAGSVGAGGLGDIAIRYGYQRYQTDVMYATIIVLVIIVQLIQTAGNLLTKRFDRRMRS